MAQAQTQTIIPAAALEQHTAIVGKTGSGKTHTAKWIVEQHVAAGARVCVLDPLKSDWFGIASSKSGKSAGLDFVILGGPRAHVPLHGSSGAAVAALVGEGSLPRTVVDMSDLEPKEHGRWFVDFASSLMRKMSGVLVLVLEEADVFAPKEKLGSEAENMRIHWSSRIARAGRSKGIRLIVSCQRTQKLHNDLIGSCDCIIAHRLISPADQKPVVEWLQTNASKETAAAISASLSRLNRGEAWVCHPESGFIERRQFPEISTFDNSATPTGAAAAAVTLGKVDVDGVRALLGAAVVEADANDPKKLRERVAKLEADLAKPHVDAGARAELSRISAELADERAKTAAMMGEIETLAAGSIAAGRKMIEAIADRRGGHTSTAELAILPAGPAGQFVATRQFQRADVERAVATPNGSGRPAPGVSRVLDALAYWEMIGITKPTRAQVAAVAGAHPRTESFLRDVAQQVTDGLVEQVPGGLTLTASGRARAPKYPRTTNRAQIVATVVERLDADGRALLEKIIRAGGSIDRVELAKPRHVRTDSFLVELSGLESRGLVVCGRGRVELAEFMRGV